MTHFWSSVKDKAMLLGYPSVELAIVGEWKTFDESTKALLEIANLDPSSINKKIEVKKEKECSEEQLSSLAMMS